MNRLLRAGPLLDQMQFVGSLPYPEFLVLLAECALAVSDSGGVQEEVSVLKRPMVVVRNSTERPGVIGVFAILRQPGEDVGEVITQIVETLDYTHRRLAETPTPYGDGTASLGRSPLSNDWLADSNLVRPRAGSSKPESTDGFGGWWGLMR